MAHSKMAPRRKVNVRGQKHSLAYINDREKRMLRQAGGSGKPGPNGIPTYFDVGEGMGGYGSGMADDATAGAGDPDGGRDDGGTYAGDAQDNADKVAARPTPFTGLAKGNIVGASLNQVSKFTRGRIEAGLRAGGTPIKNNMGEIMGVMTTGPFGLGQVYTGRMMEKGEYAGPAEFASQVTMDGSSDGGDDNVRSGAKKKVTAVDSVDGEVNLPDAPSSGEGGDATDDAKRRSKMGKESTISTTSQGLLTNPRTRNRSLMSGLIS